MAVLTDIIEEQFEKERLSLLSLDHFILWRILPFLSCWDFFVLFIVSKQTQRTFDCPRFWRVLLEQLQTNSSINKLRSRRRKMSKPGGSATKANFQIFFANFIADRAQTLISSLLLQYEIELDRNIYMEIQRVASAAIASHLIVVKPVQATCKHSQLALLLSKTVYEENSTTSHRAHPLHAKCSLCHQPCYDKCVVCCCSTASPTYFCIECNTAGDAVLGQHQRHPRREAVPAIAFLDAKDYAVHCMDCGLAFLVRLRSNSVSKFAKKKVVESPLLVCVDFLCPVRDRLSSDGCRSRMRRSTDFFLTVLGRSRPHTLEYL